MTRADKITLKDVLSEEAITRAIDRLSSRRKSSPFNQMCGADLSAFWAREGGRITSLILQGHYRPLPVVTMKIPKPGSKEKRILEIPSMQDRMLLSALQSVLSDFYDPTFYSASYGFRPGRSCHDAAGACLGELLLGSTYIIDLDIRRFFDKVNHEILFTILRKNIRDKRLLHFLKCYVTIDVINGPHIYRKRRGLSQGSAVSPVLANVYLSELDRYLEKQRAHFVRYADDLLIFCRTRSQAEAFLQLTRAFLQDVLRLRLNEEKTRIVRPWEMHYLGFAFGKKKRTGGDQYCLTLDEKTKQRMLWKMKRWIMRQPSSYLPAKHYWRRLGAFNRGWINYFRRCDPVVMSVFLHKAQQLQVGWLYGALQEKARGESSPEEALRALLQAFYETTDLTTLTGWYRSVAQNLSNVTERRITQIMSNKYTFWRSGPFYPCRTQLANTWRQFSQLPFFWEGPGRDVIIHCEHTFTARPLEDLTENDLLILGILAAGKCMTQNQLSAYMALKGTSSMEEALSARLKQLIQYGLIQKSFLSPVRGMDPFRSWHVLPPNPMEERGEPVLCYRVFSRSIRYLQEICAPIDYQIFHNRGKSSSSGAYEYYPGALLFNQVILRCLLACPSVSYFEILGSYNTGAAGKTLVPLFLETASRNYYFWHIHSTRTEEIVSAVSNWMRFRKHRRDCILVLIASDDVIRRNLLGVCRTDLYPPISRMADDIRLSLAADWFDPHTPEAGILPVCTLRSQLPYFD